jgi:hypothetical protein
MDIPAPAGTGLALKNVPEPPHKGIAEWKPLPTFVALVEVLKSDPKRRRLFQESAVTCWHTE